MKRNYLKYAYLALLFGFSIYVLLDTFVIARTYERDTEAQTERTTMAVPGETDAEEETTAKEPETVTEISWDPGEAQMDDTFYKDNHIEITFIEDRFLETNVYIADVKVSDVHLIKGAFAENKYGRNIKETTSDMAANHQAILAINGDYYGVKPDGYVFKNGRLYRDVIRDKSQEDLVLYEDGSYGTIFEGETAADELLGMGVYNLLAFGPVLLRDGEITVSDTDEVPTYNVSNPRTAIGIVEENHYLFVVSDGRTEDNVGLTLSELAELMRNYGATFAYNLDGGGSSTIYFNGKVRNYTTDGHGNHERRISDIIYVGY